MKKYVIPLCLILSLLLLCLAGCAPKPGQGAGTNQGTSASGGEGQEYQPGATADASQESPSTPGSESQTGTPVQTGRPAPDTPRPATLEEQLVWTIQATITMDDGGVIVVELFPDLAPQSVRNFVYLARQGFYDGLTFHRIINGFMIQGGCPTGTGTGNPGYSIKGEFSANGFENDLKHAPGVLSMARAGNPEYDSGGSQFFIMHAVYPSLDGQYAAFGQVVEGMDVVNRLAENTPVEDRNGTVAPANQPVIRSVTIDDDIILPEPDKLPR